MSASLFTAANTATIILTQFEKGDFYKNAPCTVLLCYVHKGNFSKTI